MQSKSRGKQLAHGQHWSLCNGKVRFEPTAFRLCKRIAPLLHCHSNSDKYARFLEREFELMITKYSQSPIYPWLNNYKAFIIIVITKSTVLILVMFLNQPVFTKVCYLTLTLVMVFENSEFCAYTYNLVCSFYFCQILVLFSYDSNMHQWDYRYILTLKSDC